MQALHGARRPRWRYTLLDATDQPLRPLDGVTAGSLEVAATTRLGGSAQLSIDERGQGIDWMSHRVQVAYDPGIPGTPPWPVGTMMFSSPTTTTGDARTTHQVDLLSKMQIVDEDSVEARYSLAAGTLLVPAVLALIQSTGETRIAVTDSAAVLTGPMSWEAGVSKLTIINDLLGAAGYWSLWCDGAGQYRVEPYVLPADRGLAYQFQAGEYSIHQAGWQRQQDLSTVPNRFVIVGQGDETAEALVAVATNENPESRFSRQARGRWITRTETGVEGTQDVLDRLAQRRLIDAMSPVAKLQVTHAIVPLDPGELVSFRPRGHTALATIQRMTYDLRFDGQCRAEWREL